MRNFLFAAFNHEFTTGISPETSIDRANRRPASRSVATRAKETQEGVHFG